MLSTISRQIKRLASALREKPDTRLDEYLLEHYIIYHGLSGTSPDNLRQEKRVKQDVLDALTHGSSLELAIALKLPPIYWQDKLPGIFSELKSQLGDRVVECLLPEGNQFDLPAESDPLRHPDWRVRSNAACLLAHLQVIEAIPRMVHALNDDNPAVKAAFCHIAAALAQLQTPESRQSLVSQLSNDEPWFVLDAVAALANWPLNDASADIARALLTPNPLYDYLAVAVAQKYGAAALLADTDELVQEGGLEVAIGLVEATRNPHCADQIAIKPAALHQCLPRLVELARAGQHPRRLKAVLTVSRWIKNNWQEIVEIDRSASAGELLRETEKVDQEFCRTALSEQLLDWLKSNAENPEAAYESRHAANLAGELKIYEAAPYLISLAAPRSASIDEAIAALSELKHIEAAPHLLKLADQTVDLDDRTTRKRSQYPVFEDNPPAAKTYWRLIGALSAFPTPETLAYLMRARLDFAPDKRQQALQSLSSLAESGVLGQPATKQVAGCLEEALGDPATPVKVTALKAVGDLKLLSLLPQVMPLVHVKDTALRRQAQATVRHLHAAGFASEVKTAINGCIGQERDRFKREQLAALLHSLSS